VLDAAWLRDIKAEAKTEMDWWIDAYSGGTPGNRMLIDINDKLAVWLENEMGIKTKKLPYYIEHGGILLKDAAVLAGLGCLGKNNMLVAPDYGSRIRLRAMFIDTMLPSTGPIDFDPCEDCAMPCRTACPQEAFAQTSFFNAFSLRLALIHPSPDATDRLPRLARLDKDYINYQTIAG
jgi:epoxyqueuosine reductase